MDISRIMTYSRRLSLSVFLIVLAGAGFFLGVVLPRGLEKVIELPEISVNARTAVILNAGTGEVLYEKNPGAKFPPASTTKVMTAIVAIENLSPEALIIPDSTVVRVEPTIVGLKPGVEYRFDDLLAAILIRSGNDAAVAIARAVAGDEKKFAVMMNDKASEIGMTDTHFVSASGLPTGKKDLQHTTAKDLAVMMRYALRHKRILEHMSQKEKNISGSDGLNIYFKTNNKTLVKRENAPWGKTGYTREASRTFVGTNPSMDPKITFALLKSEDLWNDIFTLYDKGMVIYELTSRTWRDDLRDQISVFFKWIRDQRELGKSELDHVYSARK
ncbi:MAG: D-alanyl-D-alanine carboxypeptidase [Candidatus Omnitrophica bacterium]|nr:D-alanyl-D-alanine carboxypeptidase [Candidatus Omnitrophota bacterium]